MLFSNPVAVTSAPDLHQMHTIGKMGIRRVELQLSPARYTTEELADLFRTSGTEPMAFRVSPDMGLGTPSFELENWRYWLETVAPLFLEQPKWVIGFGATVTLGEIFEFLDERPHDFNALHDFKTQYVETVIKQLRQIEEIAKPLGIHLLIENAPMGGPLYFEPGQARIHPALRTPRHLLQITQATDVKLCLDTAHARIASNVLSYMHRSRSLFAGATEKEIMNAPRSWREFYRQTQEHIAMVRLSYAVSWGDTPHTAHIPFPEEAHPELLDFAEEVDTATPISLTAGETSEQLPVFLDTLRQLKKR
ncbi:TIM barrel protein [Polycladomyces sp. WAk]|uniref:TIM barrel protein n=1 Tax=Polycladomyces zharkentensis TaxID=2807616 RepID=A0ABS2WGC9_9BACL|nr:TIM barrel protein [Polycladomyces sp. WAk]MBN2908526.1 TIM barrel protein [Polycladomyces sp. WAk]